MDIQPQFDQYDAIFGDDPASYIEFLDALEATLTKARASLLEAAAAQDWNVISTTRHSLKPTMTLLGAEPVNDLLARMASFDERFGRSTLEAALDKVIEAVSQRRSNLT